MSEKLKYSGLDVVSKLRQATVVEAVDKIDWSRGSDAPLVVEFDPTSACNLACPDCISIKLLNKGGIPRKRTKEICEEFVEAGVQAVILIGGGEPLAHPDIGWVIEYLAGNGVKLGLTTNGVLIDRYLGLIAEHVDWCRVSIDAGTDETFRHFRPNLKGSSELGRVVRNMRKLASEKTGKLGYSFLLLTEFGEDGEVTRSNVDEIFEAAALAKDIGCDYFEVKPSFDLDHFLVQQPSDLMRVAKRQIDQALTLADETFRIAGATNLHFTLQQLGREQPKPYTECKVSQLRTLVTPSGAYVCPYYRGNEDKKIGDLTKQTLKEMWSGKQRLKVMEDLDPSKDCRFHCIRHQSNLALEDMAMAGPGSVAPIDDYDPFI